RAVPATPGRRKDGRRRRARDDLVCGPTGVDSGRQVGPGGNLMPTVVIRMVPRHQYDRPDEATFDVDDGRAVRAAPAVADFDALSADDCRTLARRLRAGGSGVSLAEGLRHRVLLLTLLLAEASAGVSVVDGRSRKPRPHSTTVTAPIFP